MVNTTLIRITYSAIKIVTIYRVGKEYGTFFVKMIFRTTDNNQSFFLLIIFHFLIYFLFLYICILTHFHMAAYFFVFLNSN